MSGLYVHVPFCKRKCPYCSFYSMAALDLVPAWLDSLELEIKDAAPKWNQPFTSLYLGGGSPSLLDEHSLRRLMSLLGVFDITANAERTIEANPEDVNDDKVKWWQEAGFNRVSLGAQSFDDRWLMYSLARNHQKSHNEKAATTIIESGLDLSLDLIYGHGGQSAEDWVADLNAAAAFNPVHISTYQLTVEPGTPLAKSIANKLMPPLPKEDEAAEMFLLAAKVLAPLGFKRYEVSNFSKPGHESQHNLKYWRRQPYLGLGPSAHSFDGQNRWANVASLRQWRSALNAGQAPLSFREGIDQAAANLETLMLGLRMGEGVNESFIKNAEKLELYIEQGYLARNGQRILPTERGLALADRLALELS